MSFAQKSVHVQGPQINQFNNIAPQPIPRSSFRRDFTVRSTINADYLVPIFNDEILPGDDVNVKMNAMVRMATPLKPIMDNQYLETFWFFVPMRLLWSNWAKFQGQQTNPGDSVAYTIPILNKSVAPMSTIGFSAESVYDYLGLPINVTGLTGVSALFNRAYDLIWNEWFRDENLQNSITIPTGDGPDDPATYVLRKRNKRKDYITSGTPFPQKGTAPTVGLVGTAPVTLSTTTNVPQIIKRADNHTVVTSHPALYAQTTSGHLGDSADANKYVLDPNGTLVVDGASFSAVTINALRQAALYQQILELDARGGTRYVEAIFARFGVVSPDFRLQRPELIGQGSTRISVFAVPQTGESSVDSPQGNLAAFGTAQIHGNHGCKYAATEHGIIIGLANVRADITYQQKLPKRFTRSTRMDFYEPLMNGLGEQAVLNQEIFAQGTVADDDVFCYQERFSEMRYMDSMITGKMRSTATNSMDIWHLSQEFGSLPALNSSFIESNTPMDRILAVTDESDFFFDASFMYNHVRPMPMRSNPGIDRL